MTIVELGAFGELLGGLAVIGSLIYVGLQVRQSNRQSEAESIRAFVRDYNTLLRQLRDPAFTDIWRRGAVDFSALTRTEQTQLHAVLFNHLMINWADAAIDPQRSGKFGQFLDAAFVSMVNAPGFSQWWQQFRSVFESMGFGLRLGEIP